MATCDALDISFHPVVAQGQRVPEALLRLGVVFSQKGKHGHVVSICDLVREREFGEHGKVGRVDAADDIPTQGGRVELCGMDCPSVFS